jgi:copper(I)-binding protein
VNRALRAATMSVLLLSPVALSACSAGQVTQTATQERDKVGGSAKSGGITVRAATLEHPRGGAFDAGDDVDVRMAIINSAAESDTLVAIDGEGFGEAEISGARPESGGAGGRTGRPDEIEIPAGGTVYVGEDDADVTLTDLDEELTTGQELELVLTFENAGEITLAVPVANPDDEQARGESFNFHEEEATREGGEDGHG